MAKLWDKGFKADAKIDAFTVGKDRELDLQLAPFDILGTIAHITMLESVGLLTREELDALLPELRALYRLAEQGAFVIEPDVEDIHSQVELMLTRKLGEIGKKVHTGRSRNDQVLVDLNLRPGPDRKDVGKIPAFYSSSGGQRTVQGCSDSRLYASASGHAFFFRTMVRGLCGEPFRRPAVHEGSVDFVNRNPLGSAAGYGSSAPLNRAMTTALLGFEDLNYNSVYAQMTRGKMERIVAFAYASVAETLGRLAWDGCLFSSQNFGFIHLPDP